MTEVRLFSALGGLLPMTAVGRSVLLTRHQDLDGTTE